MQGQPTLFKPI